MPRSLAAVVEDNWNRREQRLEVHRLVKPRTYFACYVAIQSSVRLPCKLPLRDCHSKMTN